MYTVHGHTAARFSFISQHCVPKDQGRVIVNPPTVATWMRTAIKHPVPDRVKPSIVIFGIQAL